jgi:hypothetical protein
MDPLIHKKSYATVVKSNLVTRTSVFKRLRFPVDYHLNYITDSSISFGRQNLPRNDHGNRKSDGFRSSRNSNHGDRKLDGFRSSRDSNSNLENFERKVQSTGASINADIHGNIYGPGFWGRLKETERMLRNRIFRGICFNCLAPGHMKSLCTNKVWCRICFHYGQVAKSCLSKFPSKIYRWKSPDKQEVISLKGSERNPSHPPEQTIPSSSLLNPPLSPSLADEHATILAPMANTPVNPEPLVPRGFVICTRLQEEDTP